MGFIKHCNIQRRLPLLIGVFGGIGGIFPDFEHIYRIFINPEYAAFYLHRYGWVVVIGFLIGSIIAFSRRYVATLVLTKMELKNSRRPEGYKNLFPETLIDEVSGIGVPNDKHD